MSRQIRRILALAALALLAAAAVALAAGPKKGATYKGTLAKNREPIALKVAKNGKSVTASVQFAPLYCQGGGAGERQITKPAAIASNGSFSASIVYEFVPTHKKTAKLEIKGKFSGKSVKGTARSLFGLESLEALRNLGRCDGTTTFTATTK